VSVPAYPAYRESGSRLLGLTPAHWTVERVKRFARLVYGDALPTEARNEAGEVPVFGSNGIVGVHDTSITSAPALIIGRKGSFGSIAWSDVPAFVIDTGYFVDSTAARCELRWLYWALHAADLTSVSLDTGVPGLARETVHDLLFVNPPLPEQRAIAAFLDRECGKIDGLVAEQERLVALLKEKRQAVISEAVTKGLDPAAPTKPSGLPWLGNVPAHWEVKRIGALFGEVFDEGEHDLPVLSVSIHDGVSDRELADEEMERKVSRSEDRSKYKKVQPGDLVYNMMRAWQGGFGTVAVPGMVSPAYVVARPKTTARTQYIELLLRTPCAVEEMRRHSRGVTDFRLRLYWDEFKNIKVPVPPLAEQDAILEAIDVAVDQGNSLTTEAERAIALLRERRAALISAAVTGKIDVRGLAPAAEAA
jgi:type I restriction enzyme S subunit